MNILAKTLSIVTIAWIFLLYPSVVYAQQKHTVISGQVIDVQSKKPITGVQVKIIGDNRVISYAITDLQGQFKLSFGQDPKQHEVECSHISYATRRMKIEPTMIVELQEQDISIKEVIIRVPKIGQRSDTITYNVSYFAVTQDRTIGDVLKKLPGVEVSKSGEIKYQGQSINKFYIEGSDLLGGRYGLATNNISHKDVLSVQVIENHQPIKALQDITFTDRAAINIKLKSDAKSRWAGTIKGGLGVTPLLWDAELFAMRFKRNLQTFNTYKTNNIGTSTADQSVIFSTIGDFSLDDNVKGLSYIDVRPDYAYNLNPQRTRFNESHTLSSNNLIKLGDNYNLKPEFVFGKTRLTGESHSQATYFMGDDTIIVEDNYKSSSEVKEEASGKIILNANTDKLYLNNSLKYDINWVRLNVNSEGSYPNDQRTSLGQRSLSNNLDILQRIGKKMITIHSLNEYIQAPQLLNVKRNEELSLNQSIDLTTFNSNNSIGYSHTLGQFLLSTNLGLSYHERNMKNGLTGEITNDISDEIISSNSSFSKFNLNINPSLEYKQSPIEIRLSIPLYNLSYSYKNVSAPQEREQVFGISPSIYFKWYMLSNLEMSMNASVGKELPDEARMYSGLILNNYRDITKGFVDFKTGNRGSASFRLKYKNISSMFFSGINVTYAVTRNKRVLNQTFLSDYILYSYTHGENEINMWLMDVVASKGIDALKGTIALFLSYGHSQMMTKRNGVELPYKSENYSLRLKANSKLSAWCNLTYESEFIRYKLVSLNSEIHTKTDNFTQSLAISMNPINGVNITLSAEHYVNQLSAKEYKNFIFTDMSTSYVIGDRFEIGCKISNLLNNKSFSYLLTDNYGTIFREFRIRPVNIMLNITCRF